MKVQLSKDLQDNPDGAVAADIVRSCVHCGFCTATCPTYQVFGDELDGPRGRIYLIKEVLEGVQPSEQTQLHLEGTDADTGQTLGVYGLGPGPYILLPTLPPLTVRDGIGYGVDGFLDPLGQFTPLAAAISLSVVQRINERALNLDWFQDVEDSALDLYSAVRNAYLQRRRRSIEAAIAERNAEWR